MTNKHHTHLIYIFKGFYYVKIAAVVILDAHIVARYCVMSTRKSWHGQKDYNAGKVAYSCLFRRVLTHGNIQRDGYEVVVQHYVDKHASNKA